MNGRRRYLLILLVVLLVLAVPSTALANKRRYDAKLRPGNEVPPAIGTTATGSGRITYLRPGETTFTVSAQRLSGTPVGVHLHAPAPDGVNAPVILTLCGSPGPAAVPVCPSLDPATGAFALDGFITPELLQGWGLTGGQLRDWLDAGEVYINVHTPSYPAGEIRGQLLLSAVVPG